MGNNTQLKIRIFEIFIWSLFFISVLIYTDGVFKKKRILYRSTLYEQKIPTDSWGKSPTIIDKRTNTKLSDLKVVTYNYIFINGKKIIFKNDVITSYNGNQFNFQEYDLHVNYHFYKDRLFFISINGSRKFPSSKRSTSIIIEKYGYFQGGSDPIDISFSKIFIPYNILYSYDASINKNKMHITFYSKSYEEDDNFKIIYLYKPILEEIELSQ